MLFVFLLLAFSRSQADELVLLNWDEYLADEVVTAFQHETGHTIRSVIYDSDEQRDEILSSSSGNEFDLVVIDSMAAQLFGNNHLLEKIVRQKIPSLDHIDPRWRESCGRYGVPYFWGTSGIVYRSDKLQQKPDSWADLLVPTDALKGHVGMHLDFYDTLVPPLKMAGASINTENTQQLKAAYELLLKQKPHVLTYQYAISFMQEAHNKDQLHMAFAYSGDQYALNGDDEDGPWHYVIPKEGTAIWIDCLSVVATTTKKMAAFQFIEFINRPNIAALNANEVGSATVNMAALKLLHKEILEDTSLYPAQKTIENSEYYRLLSDANLRQRNRIRRAIAK